MGKIIVPVLCMLTFVLQSGAQKSPVFVANDKAIRGYDAVAYFTQGKAVKGSSDFVHSWQGADWYFSSRQHLDSFSKAPEKYVPQYGGYCAYGCSNGYKASIDPTAWTIVNGKLYLNYSLKIRDEWDRNRAERIKKADQIWPVIKDKG
jgi:YHS domain-containing protein